MVFRYAVYISGRRREQGWERAIFLQMPAQFYSLTAESSSNLRQVAGFGELLVGQLAGAGLEGGRHGEVPMAGYGQTFFRMAARR